MSDDLNKTGLELLAEAQRTINQLNYRIKDLELSVQKEREKHRETVAALSAGSTPGDKAKALVGKIWDDIRRSDEWEREGEYTRLRSHVVDHWAWHLERWLTEGKIP